MQKIISVISVLALLSSCGGTMQDKVIQRSDNRSSRPSWVKEETPLTQKDGNLYFFGQARIPAEKANISMGYRIADNNAKNSIAAAINQNLNYIFQNAEEGTTYDTTQIQFISTESAKALMSKAIPTDHYWEKVLSTINGEGDKEMFYSLYSRVKISEADMKAAVQRTLNGSKGISEDLKKKAEQQWNLMISEQYAISEN